MRTTSAATSDVASGESERRVFHDTLFRDMKERVVDPPVLPAGARFADTHAHLDMLHHPELALARCAAHGVDYIVTVIDPTEEPAYTLDNLDSWLEWDRGQWDGGQPPVPLRGRGAVPRPTPPSPCHMNAPTVRIIAGCHPHNASKYNGGIEQALLAALRDPCARALGEIGLDYHYDHSPREVQQQVYRRQLELAHELGLPVALHMREAHDDGLRILKEVGVPPAGTLLHCFNLGHAMLEPFLELGCYVAYGGPVTFKKSDDVRDSARRTPLERIVTETDAPFMAPHPVRGVVCGSEHVIFTAACLAEVFGIASDGSTGSEARAKDFYDRLFQNALDFFET